MRIRRKKGGIAILAVAVIAIGALAGAVPESASLPATGSARLVSIQHLPEMGEMCTWEEYTAASADLNASLRPEDLWALRQQTSAAPLVASLQQPENLFAALEPQRQAAGTAAVSANRVLMPERTIRDLEPTYSAIGLDLRTNEVILQDNNLWSTRVFNRTDSTPAGVKLTEEKRVISGDKTEIQFNNGLYIDPNNGDIYSVESDVGDKMVVFPHDANGNVAPKRKLHTVHRVYNIAVDEARQELFVTIEFPSEIDVYRKEASGEELPIRRLVGPNTGLNSVHGIAVDEKNQLLYLNTWGHVSDFRVEGTGRFELPAIKVYALNASGDTPPLRVIQGDKTQLNWPGAMKLNPENGDLYVANDIGQSLLVFGAVAGAQGNVAPVRTIKGPKTHLSYPTGVALDLTNREVWASNMGSASATAYPLMADGDVAPVRIIRSAPEGKKALNFGRTTAVAYDSKRQQILVPN